MAGSVGSILPGVDTATALAGSHPQPPKTSGVRTWIQLLEKEGFNTGTALIGAAIILAESGGDTHARNVNTDGSVDRGAWQINNKAHPDVTDKCADDPVCATKAAFRISSGGRDFRPWTTFTSGAYKKHLDEALKATITASGTFSDVGGAADAVSGAASAVAGWAESLGKLLSALLDPHTWIRVVEVIGGAVLMLMALKELTGGSVDPIGAARKVAPV